MRKGRAHLVRRAHGTQGVVLVDVRDPEDGHHGIADELLHGSAVPLQHHAHLIEVAGHERAQGLGVESLTQRGGAGDVAEHHRDCLAHLACARGRAREVRRALQAELRPVRVLRAH